MNKQIPELDVGVFPEVGFTEMTFLKGELDCLGAQSVQDAV